MKDKDVELYRRDGEADSFTEMNYEIGTWRRIIRTKTI